MDYKAKRADPEQVKKLKTAVAQERWNEVRSWYHENTPWVSENGINQFIEDHMREFDQLGRYYYEEIKKKMQEDKINQDQQTDQGKNEISMNTVEQIKETIQILEQSEKKTKKKIYESINESNIPGFQ